MYFVYNSFSLASNEEAKTTYLKTPRGFLPQFLGCKKALLFMFLNFHMFRKPLPYPTLLD